jgi:hypothetical protein
MHNGHELAIASRAASAPYDDASEELGECMKLIRKLRWIGLEDEANRLQQTLCNVAPEQRGTVLADPVTTD